jgi:hypothetical protein
MPRNCVAMRLMSAASIFAGIATPLMLKKNESKPQLDPSRPSGQGRE